MGILKLFELASRMDKLGVTVTRVGLIVVLLWIGGLKAFRYEADGIVPFVANSPTMSFFYADAGNYKVHKTSDNNCHLSNNGRSPRQWSSNCLRNHKRGRRRKTSDDDRWPCAVERTGRVYHNTLNASSFPAGWPRLKDKVLRRLKG